MVTFPIHFLFWRINTFSGSNYLEFCRVWFVGFFLKHHYCVHSSTVIYYQNKCNEKVPTRISAFLTPHAFHCGAWNSRIGTIPLLWPAMEVTSPLERITTLLRKDYCSQPMCTAQIVLSNIHSRYNEEIPLKPHSRKTTGMQFIKITALGSLASSQHSHKIHWEFQSSLCKD